MSGCKHCGYLEAEEPRTCLTCGSVMIWAQAQFGGLWGGYRRNQAQQEGLWKWLCPNVEDDWHRGAEALLKWVNQCPDEKFKEFVHQSILDSINENTQTGTT